MSFYDDIFKYKSFDEKKLTEYGFTRDGEKLCLKAPIMEGQFYIAVRISPEGGADVSAYESDSCEEYTLFKIEGAAGEFVGKMRAEAEEILQDIAEKCCRTQIFKLEQTQRILQIARQLYGDEAEFLWDKLPDCAVLRRKDCGKWYAVIMAVQKGKILDGGEGLTEALDLRADPEEIDGLADGKRYFRGYHMNKKHWFTVLLDGGVSTEEIQKRLKKSYALAVKK